MWEARVVHETETQNFLLYLFQRSNDGTVIALTADNISSIVDQGGRFPVFAKIPEFAAEAIAEALQPRPQVTNRHLEDAMCVRDRLLQMLERQNEAATVRP